MTGTYITVRINKSANLRVVVTGVEIIEPGFRIVVITSVSERVIYSERRSHRARYGQNVAPRIVGISDNNRAGSIQYRKNVVTEIFTEIIVRAVIYYAENASAFVVEILLNRSVAVFADDL